MDTGSFVVVNPTDIHDCALAAACGGMVGIVEDLWTDADGSIFALVFFGRTIPRIYTDSAWIAAERLLLKEDAA